MANRQQRRRLIWQFPYRKPFVNLVKKFSFEQAADYFDYFYDYDNRNWFIKFDGSFESSFLLAFLTDVLKRIEKRRSLDKIIYIVYPDICFDTLEYRAEIERQLQKFVNENATLGFCVVFARPKIAPIQRFIGMGQTLPRNLMKRFLKSYPRKFCRSFIRKLDKNNPWEVATTRYQGEPKPRFEEPLKYAISKFSTNDFENYMQTRQDASYIPCLSDCRKTSVSVAAEQSYVWERGGKGLFCTASEFPAVNLIDYCYNKYNDDKKVLNAKRCVKRGYKGGRLDIETREHLEKLLKFIQIERNLSYLDADGWNLATWLRRRDNRAIRHGKLIDRKRCIEPDCRQLLFDFMTE